MENIKNELPDTATFIYKSSGLPVKRPEADEFLVNALHSFLETYDGENAKEDLDKWVNYYLDKAHYFIDLMNEPHPPTQTNPPSLS